MKKVILMSDIIYTPIDVLRNDYWVFRVFYPIMRDAISKDIELTYDIKDSNGECFSRDTFWGLHGIKPNDFHEKYKTSEFNQEQINYLKRFFNQDTVIIGFEIYQPLCDLLTTFGVKVIDIAFHPFKLFDDLAFGFYTNDREVYSQLLKYQIPQEKFYYYANYWQTVLEYNHLLHEKNLKNIQDNSAVFIGQTFRDRSVDDNNKFLNVTDYENKLKELSEKYSKVYYVPHPYLGNFKKFIYDYVKKSPYITLLKYISTYALLASPKVKKVVGISTSVLYEAKYFNKEVEMLFKPLFEVDTTFEEHSYVSILDDYKTYGPISELEESLFGEDETAELYENDNQNENGDGNDNGNDSTI